jgi:hypothetical protein
MTTSEMRKLHHSPHGSSEWMEAQYNLTMLHGSNFELSMKMDIEVELLRSKS